MKLLHFVLCAFLTNLILSNSVNAQNLCQLRTAENEGLPTECIKYWNEVPVVPGSDICVFNCVTTNTDNPFDLSCQRVSICRRYCGLNLDACSDPKNTSQLAQFQENSVDLNESSDEPINTLPSNESSPTPEINNSGPNLPNNPEGLLDSDNDFNNPDIAQQELLEDATVDLTDRLESIIDILTQSSDIAGNSACELGGGDCGSNQEQTSDQQAPMDNHSPLDSNDTNMTPQ